MSKSPKYIRVNGHLYKLRQGAPELREELEFRFKTLQRSLEEANVALDKVEEDLSTEEINYTQVMKNVGKFMMILNSTKVIGGALVAKVYEVVRSKEIGSL